MKKNSVVVAQKFEDAASFRDIEQKLLNKLSKLQKNWKLDEKSNPVKITENDIADMISMVTTIPVNKVAQNEAENLLKMNYEKRTLDVGVLDIYDDKLINTGNRIHKKRKSFIITLPVNGGFLSYIIPDLF